MARRQAPLPQQDPPRASPAAPASFVAQLSWPSFHGPATGSPAAGRGSLRRTRPRPSDSDSIPALALDYRPTGAGPRLPPTASPAPRPPKPPPSRPHRAAPSRSRPRTVRARPVRCRRCARRHVTPSRRHVTPSHRHVTPSRPVTRPTTRRAAPSPPRQTYLSSAPQRPACHGTRAAGARVYPRHPAPRPCPPAAREDLVVQHVLDPRPPHLVTHQRRQLPPIPPHISNSDKRLG